MSDLSGSWAENALLKTAAALRSDTAFFRSIVFEAFDLERLPVRLGLVPCSLW